MLHLTGQYVAGIYIYIYILEFIQMLKLQKDQTWK